MLLGAGNRLSLLVTDGPARLLLATGDNPIEYENALTHVQPIFARRVDVLLVAGSGDTLLVPLAAHGDSHVRNVTALAPLPHSAEADAIGAIPSFSSPQQIRLGPSTQVTVETAFPFGADADAEFPAWRHRPAWSDAGRGALRWSGGVALPATQRAVRAGGLRR